VSNASRLGSPPPSAIPRARYTRGISTEGEWDHEGDERGDAAMMKSA
jgi:hypothetical protein